MTDNARMKAYGIRRYKTPLELLELPRPEPGPNDLLVKVRAASVNPVDFKIREGGVKVLIPTNSHWCWATIWPAMSRRWARA